MIVDVNTEILNYRGEVVKEGEKSVLVGDVLFTACDRGGEQRDDNKQKLLRYRLSMRIVAAMDGDGKVSLTASEAAMIMESVGRLYGPLVVGRVSEIIDGPEDEVTD